MLANDWWPGAKDESGLGIRSAAPATEGTEEHIELSRVVTGDPELVIRRAAEMKDLEDWLELRRRCGEVVGVGVRRDRHADKRLELSPARPRIDERREARDHAGVAKPPHAVRSGVRAESHRRAEVPPRYPAVLAEKLEDLTVGFVHDRDYLG